MSKINKQYLVIGLGNFGFSLAKTLYEKGADVLAVDKQYELINAIEPFSTQAVCMDATDEQNLSKLGLSNMDVGFVCTSDIEASIFICLTLLQGGIKRVIAKAINEKHKTVLERLGVHKVIIPEQEMGRKTALNIIRPGMIEILSLSDNFTLVEIKTPEKWQGKTVLQLDLRKTEKINIMAIKRGDTIITDTLRDCVLEADDLLLVYGSKQHTDKLSAKATKTVET